MEELLIGLAVIGVLILIAAPVVMIIISASLSSRVKQLDRKMIDLNKRIINNNEVVKRKLDSLIQSGSLPTQQQSVEIATTQQEHTVPEVKTTETTVPSPVTPIKQDDALEKLEQAKREAAEQEKLRKQQEEARLHQELEVRKKQEAEQAKKAQQQEQDKTEAEKLREKLKESKRKTGTYASTVRKEPTPVFEHPTSGNQPKVQVPAKKQPSRPKQKRDLEKYIGENLISKIGIAVFVLGIAYLVKLGIDNEVITKPMRVAIGVLTGGILIGIAHFLRKSYRAFSSILIGGGLATLYFSVGLAHREYDMFGSKTIPFVIMAAITVFAVVLSLAYDKKELAVISLIGGFATPLIVSDGTGSHIDLFTYILILDIGMLLLVYFKKWNIVNYISYILTYALYGVVFYLKFWEADNPDYMGFFIFLTAFYLIFHLMAIVYNVRNKRKFNFMDISLLLTNSAIYFGLGVVLLKEYPDVKFQGLFTALNAVFNAIFVFVLYRRKDIDKNLLYLLIGLVLSFTSLIAPLQLDGNNITLFWAVEFVLLIWLGQKSKIRLIESSSVLVMILMLISLGMDWEKLYFHYTDPAMAPLLNRAFMTSAFAIACLFLGKMLIDKSKAETFVGIPTKHYNTVMQILSLSVLYLGILVELDYQFLQYELIYAKRIILMGVYHFAYVAGLSIYAGIVNRPNFNKFMHIVRYLAIASYFTLFLSYTIIGRNMGLVRENVDMSAFNWHYALMILFLGIITWQYIYIQKTYSFKSGGGKTALWFLALFSIMFFSAEATHLVVVNQYQPGFQDYSISELTYMSVRTYYPVIWGVLAFVFMTLGMKYKMKTLRLPSLVLFFITLAKLGLWDLRDNNVGRVIALTSIGAILLVVSFLYQKLKFIVQDDAKTVEGSEKVKIPSPQQEKSATADPASESNTNTTDSHKNDEGDENDDSSELIV